MDALWGCKKTENKDFFFPLCCPHSFLGQSREKHLKLHLMNFAFSGMA